MWLFRYNAANPQSLRTYLNYYPSSPIERLETDAQQEVTVVQDGQGKVSVLAELWYWSNAVKRAEIRTPIDEIIASTTVSDYMLFDSRFLYLIVRNSTAGTFLLEWEINRKSPYSISVK